MFQERVVISKFKNINLLNNKVITPTNSGYSTISSKIKLTHNTSANKSRDISNSCLTDITKNRNNYLINLNKTVTMARLTPSGKNKNSHLKLISEHSQNNIGYKGKMSSKGSKLNTIECEYNGEFAKQNVNRASLFKIRNFPISKRDLLRNNIIHSHHNVHKTEIELIRKREPKIQWLENIKPFTKNHESQKSNWVYQNSDMTTPNIESSKYGMINYSETKNRFFKESIKHQIHNKTKSISSYLSVINAPKNNQDYMNSLNFSKSSFHKSNGIASSFILKKSSFGPFFNLYKK